MHRLPDIRTHEAPIVLVGYCGNLVTAWPSKRQEQRGESWSHPPGSPNSGSMKWKRNFITDSQRALCSFRGQDTKRFGKIFPPIMQKAHNNTWTAACNGLEEMFALCKRHTNSHTGLLVTTTTTLPSSKIVKNESSSNA